MPTPSFGVTRWWWAHSRCPERFVKAQQSLPPRHGVLPASWRGDLLPAWGHEHMRDLEAGGPPWPLCPCPPCLVCPQQLAWHLRPCLAPPSLGGSHPHHQKHLGQDVTVSASFRGHERTRAADGVGVVGTQRRRGEEPRVHRSTRHLKGGPFMETSAAVTRPP